VILGIALLGSAFSATSALPAPAGGTPDVPGPPSLPQGAPPVPVQVPVPIPPPSKVTAPVEAAPTPTPSPPPAPIRSVSTTGVPDAGADPARVPEKLGGRSDAAGTPTGATAEAARSTAVPVHGVSRRTSGSSDGPAARGRSPQARAHSVTVAGAAPLRPLVAYVWPAIALRSLVEALVSPFVTQLADLERVPSLTLPGIFTSPSPLDGGVKEAPRRSARTPEPIASRPDPLNAFTPQGGGMSLLLTAIAVLAALVGVVSLARLTVGEDLFSSRWLH
jgi:hypothetical protein